MTASEVRRRWLRPGLLVPVGARLWVVDVMQPVAAVYDVATAQRVALVGWPETPPGPEPEGRRVFPAPDGLWVQQPGGPVALVDEDGLRSGYYAADLVLGAVSARTGRGVAQHGNHRTLQPRKRRLLRTGAMVTSCVSFDLAR